MAETGEVFRFRKGRRSAREIQEAIDEALAELHDPNSVSSRRASEVGLDRSGLASGSVTVSESKQGIEPLTTTIAVTIVGGVLVHVANKFIDAVIIPKIKDRFGSNGVSERLEE